MTICNEQDRCFQKKRIGSLDSLIKELLDLRDAGFWSFRGQRKENGWHLGLQNISDHSDHSLCLKQFKKRCMEFSRLDYIDESDEWRWLFYAQHYRLRTRMLDWTSNPLVALYFAVENILSHGDDEADYGVVWALRVRSIDFLSPEHAGELKYVSRWIMINSLP